MNIKKIMSIDPIFVAIASTLLFYSFFVYSQGWDKVSMGFWITLILVSALSLITYKKILENSFLGIIVSSIGGSVVGLLLMILPYYIRLGDREYQHVNNWASLTVLIILLVIVLMPTISILIQRAITKKKIESRLAWNISIFFGITIIATVFIGTIVNVILHPII